MKIQSQPGQPAPRAAFPKAARLLKHADFDRVYKTGRKHFAAHMTVFYLAGGRQAARVGFTVSRALGGAVERNRIRRRLREAVRLHWRELTAAADVVINPRRSAALAEFAELEREVSAAFRAIGRKAGKGEA